MKLRFALMISIFAIFAAAILFWLYGRGSAPSTINSNASATRSAKAPEDFTYVPSPHISLRINGTHEPLVYQGTPLLFSLRAANQRAINAALINRAREERLAGLQEKFSKGQVQKEKFEEQSAVLRRNVPVKSVELGTQNADWEQFIQFVQLLPGGQKLALSWPIQRIEADSENRLLLDAKTTVQLDFGLDPAVATNIAPGDYVIVGVLEVPNSANLPAEQWRGRVETEPVTLKIMAQQKQLSPKETVGKELDFVNYFLAKKQAAPALEHAQAALAANPTDIEAAIAVGDARNAQNDGQGALVAYEKALEEFYKQPLVPYEPPSLLTSKIAHLREQLATRP